MIPTPSRAIWMVVSILSIVGFACSSTSVDPQDCVIPHRDIVDGIEEGLTTSGNGVLRDARAVRSTDFNAVWMVAADIDAPGLEGDGPIAVWAVSGGVGSLHDLSGIFAVGSAASEFSDWGSSGGLEQFSRSDHGYDESIACVRLARR